MAVWLDTWFVQLAGQALVCLGLGCWIASRYADRPSRSHLILFMALVATLMAPLASLVVREVNLGVMPGPAEPNRFWLLDESLHPDSIFNGQMLIGVLEAGWCFLAVFLVLRIVVSYFRGCRLIEQSERVTDRDLLQAFARAKETVGLRIEPELRTHAGVPGPMVWAWSRSPVALIPKDVATDSKSIDWESIFIHELAHVARRDHVTSVLADVIVAVLFWNPAIWWVRRQLAKQCEYACDDCVAAADKSPVEFAATLLAVRREAAMLAIPATNLEGGRAWLRTRIERLLSLGEKPTIRSGRVWTGVVVIMTMLVVSALALAQTHRAPRPENSFACPLAVSSSSQGD